jgi:hypothetical protein
MSVIREILVLFLIIGVIPQLSIGGSGVNWGALLRM